MDILYGRRQSPFARRVMIWLALQERPFEQRDILVQGPEFDVLKELNPAGRVPLLVLENGVQLLDCQVICAWLDASAPPERRLTPSAPEAALAAARALGPAHAATEKGVALVYERDRRPEDAQWPLWIERLQGQVGGALWELEALTPASAFFGGETPNAVDVAAVAAIDFIALTSPALVEDGFPRLQALSGRANALPAFADSRPPPPSA